MKYNNATIKLCILFVMLYACEEQEPKPKSLEQCSGKPCDFAPYIWKKQITDEAYTYSCIDLPIVYKNAGL
ncbi:MAG TPA: hypothetical protein PK199_04210, partial [Bacteroidales bacterium]|nr:hypothetical protein [Bacteroidales bacterium]